MSRHETIIQWLKIALALIGGGYFFWWSLGVLHLLSLIWYNTRTN